MNEPAVTPPAVPPPSATPPVPPPVVVPPGETEHARDLRAQLKAIAAERDAAAARATAAEAEANRYKADLSGATARHNQELVLARAGGQFGHPSVQRAIRAEYAEYQRETGESAMAFDAWFGDPETRSNPLIGRFFDNPPAAGVAAGTPPPPVKPPPTQPPPVDPNKGAREPQADPPRELTPAEVQAAIRNAPRGPGAKLPKDVMDRVQRK